MNIDYRTILKTLDIEALPPEKQQVFLEELHELVFKSSLVRIVEHMDDTTKESFEKLMDSDASEEEIENFFAQHVPNADKIVEEVLQEISSDILSGTDTNQA